MGITVTESAAKQILRQIQNNGGGVGLRVGVRKAGCSGFAYTLNIADRVLEGDMVFESHGAKVVVDKETLPILDGTEVDYAKEGLGHVFKFNNPNVKDQCGCGESFAV
jgi:iron-sulfur cluster assembly protein